MLERCTRWRNYASAACTPGKLHWNDGHVHAHYAYEPHTVSVYLRVAKLLGRILVADANSPNNKEKRKGESSLIAIHNLFINYQ